jgi:hypothetical protein
VSSTTPCGTGGVEVSTVALSKLLGTGSNELIVQLG